MKKKTNGLVFVPPMTSKIYNQLPRHEMILKLLADIELDMVICELEGWDRTEYIKMLYNEIEPLYQKVKDLKDGK